MRNKHFQKKVRGIRKAHIENRNKKIHERVNFYYSQTIDGIRLNFEDVIKKVAEDFFMQPSTIKQILKNNG